jgi:hypothetical protein
VPAAFGRGLQLSRPRCRLRGLRWIDAATRRRARRLAHLGAPGSHFGRSRELQRPLAFLAISESPGSEVAAPEQCVAIARYGDAVIGTPPEPPLPDADIFSEFSDDDVATYLFRLPFGLALDPARVHSLQLASIDDQGRPGPETTSVDFRLVRIMTGGERYVPEHLNEAASQLYGSRIPFEDPDARYAPDEAYELWVSAETPLRRLRDEPDYPARTLERCLRALRLLLAAYRLVTRDGTTYPIGPASVSKSVPVGVRMTDGTWRHLMSLIMRPESGIPTYPTQLTDGQIAAFNEATYLVSVDHPFIRGKDLELTAHRQAYALDDLPSAIVSLQTAMESTLFDIWRMALVDGGMSSAEIATRTGSDTPFKSLVTSVLPSILGGRWDITAPQTTVGGYWNTLYQLRNTVIHSAADVQEWQYDIARQAHLRMIRHVAELLLQKWRTYPRTLLAFGIARGLPEGLSPSKRAADKMAELHAEPTPYWLPASTP